MTHWLRTFAPRKALVVVLMTFLLIAGMGCSDGGAPSPTAPSSPEEIDLQAVEVAAPDFTLPTLEDGNITLSSMKGKVVLLNFWQVNCPPCVEEMPWLEAAARQYDGQAYVVAVGIAVDAEGARDFVGEGDLQMIVPLDMQAQAAAKYSVGYTPTTFFIDRAGVVRYVKVGGFASAIDISAAIGFTLAGGA